MENVRTLDQDPRRTHLAAFLQLLVAANVLFPAAIVVFGVACFAFGSRLSAWVLPIAGLSTLLSLRAFSSSWRIAGRAAALAAAVSLGAYVIAKAFFDCSWDGLAYHQEAVLQIAAGWNPIFEHAQTPGHWHELWLDRYPQASWIAGAAVLLNCGQIEAGKLFNFTLMVAAGAQVAAMLLRLTMLRIAAVAAIAVLAACNPVCVYQSTTFCVDGSLGSLLTVVVAGLAMYIAAPRWSTLTVIMLALGLAINIKFTGLVYAAVLLGLSVLIAWRRNGWRPACQLAGAVAIAGALAVGALGYSPYVRNLREKGELFYPIMGAPNLVGTSSMRPVNLNDKNRFMRFLIANLSRSERVRSPDSTQLKFPFWVGAEERGGWWVADVEAGGFGPFYGALLLLAGAGLLGLFAYPSARPTGRIVLLVAGCLAVSIFSINETWWARYVPQAWLLPLPVAIACLLTPRRSRLSWLGAGILALAAANVFFVGYWFSRYEWNYSKATQRCLREMSLVRQPVSVHLGPFQSLRQRLREANVDFQQVETPSIPEAGTARHDIPAPSGQSYWSR